MALANISAPRPMTPTMSNTAAFRARRPRLNSAAVAAAAATALLRGVTWVLGAEELLIMYSDLVRSELALGV